MGSDNPHVTDSDMSGIFDDPTFNNLQYDNYGASDYAFDTNRLFDLGGAGSVDSPNFAIRTPSKSGYEGDMGQQNQPFNSRSLISTNSAESSSQDSSSESSSRRKRKTTSESPPADRMAIKMEGTSIRPQDTMKDPKTFQNLQQFGTSMNNLSLDQEFARGNAAMNSHFDFDSAASSPGAMEGAGGPYSSQAPMNSHYQLPNNGTNAGTMEPTQFFFNSNTASPNSNKATRTTEASPHALYANTTTSSAADMFGENQMWATANQNPAWSNEYSNAFASPGALGLTPSPVNTDIPQHGQGALPAEEDRIPLHIGPIPAKSRVETQINIRMTLDRVPPGVKNLHLPTHTIAKAKLLAKDPVPSEDTLELHTMLVCTSAMKQPHIRERALRHAAAQDNIEIQARGQTGAMKSEEEEADGEDKPAEGGEVKICLNCINRERKRAARKKLKKEEEQAHWEKYETERVIVFNTNEHKPWQEWQQSPPPKDQAGNQTTDYYPPSETAMQVTAPMRIACYCRHQNEKDGFQVIFTIKDYRGKVVAQQMSDSILITDDHKTHPLATMPGSVWYDGQYPGGPGSFASSQSMVDLHSHMPSMSMSKSTGNLHQMGFGAQPFHGSSSLHQMSGYPSQPTSGTMTPRNLSRPASPTGLSGAGPSKKRKSSSAHRRMPSGLAMTRVDTSQAMASAAPSAISGPSPFSPTSAGFPGAGDPSYITLPHSGSRAQYHTNPPTPNEGPQFPYGALSRNASMDNTTFQAFYSAPSSAHQSRAPSPVQMGPNLAAFQRQQGHSSQSTMPIRSNPFAVPGSSMQTAAAEPERPSPIINKVTPAEGPTSGGIEVSIYGSGFTPGMEIMFGDRVATATTFWGEKALCCVLPPGPVGTVPVIIAPSQMRQFPSPSGGHAQVFKYTNETTEMQMMEMALRFYSLKTTGNADRWQSLAQDAANAWVSQGPSSGHGGYQGQHGSNFNGQSANMDLEDSILRILDKTDLDDSPHDAQYDLASPTGSTMLYLACSLGLLRVCAALLARGANPDVRETGGYTALMAAVMHGHTKMFRLLLLKGSDATIRSLNGYSAADLAPSSQTLTDLQDAFVHTKRTRHATITIPVRPRSSSLLSSMASWDISDASYCTSQPDEDDASELRRPPSSSWNPSRRGSILQAVAPSNSSPLGEEKESQDAPAAAMLEWRESLAIQIQLFQQSVHRHMPQFQLPILPPLPVLPDYQDNPMVRRISSLVPQFGQSSTEATSQNVAQNKPTLQAESRFWDFFSGSSTPTPPPPAYEDLFPNNSRPVSVDTGLDSSAATAVLDTIVDAKLAMVFDGEEQACKGHGETSTAVPEPKIVDSRLFFVWTPLIIALTATIMQVRPSIMTAWNTSFSETMIEPSPRLIS